MKKNKYNDNIVKVKDSKSINSSKDWGERVKNWIENHQWLTWMIGGILILLWGIVDVWELLDGLTKDKYRS